MLSLQTNLNSPLIKPSLVHANRTLSSPGVYTGTKFGAAGTKNPMDVVPIIGVLVFMAWNGLAGLGAYLAAKPTPYEKVSQSLVKAVDNPDKQTITQIVLQELPNVQHIIQSAHPGLYQELNAADAFNPATIKHSIDQHWDLFEKHFKEAKTPAQMETAFTQLMVDITPNPETANELKDKITTILDAVHQRNFNDGTRGLGIIAAFFLGFPLLALYADILTNVNNREISEKINPHGQVVS